MIGLLGFFMQEKEDTVMPNINVQYTEYAEPEKSTKSDPDNTIIFKKNHDAKSVRIIKGATHSITGEQTFDFTAPVKILRKEDAGNINIGQTKTARAIAAKQRNTNTKNK